MYDTCPRCSAKCATRCTRALITVPKRVSGCGAASCSGGNGSYVETISWDNGNTSTLRASFVFAFGAATATGTITEGELAGAQVRDVEFVIPDDASACASSTGVTSASYHGALTFGGS